MFSKYGNFVNLSKNVFLKDGEEIKKERNKVMTNQISYQVLIKILDFDFH